MKKIVRIISRLNIGGPAIHTILLSQGLNNDGYTDILICGQVSRAEGDMIYFAKSHNVEPILIPELTREISIGRDIIAFFKIYSILRKERPDIVHTHTAKAGALGRLAALLAGVPIKVHTFHGHIFEGYFSPFKAKMFLLIERFLAFFTDKVIVVSERVKDEMVKKLKVTKREKCAVIPLGLELEKFFNCDKLKGSFRKQIDMSDDTLLVGIVGRLVPIKNHKMFLDAARRITNDMPELKIKFLVIGDGELNSNLKTYASALKMEGKIIFTGWIDDLAGTYSDLDIVVLTSLNEGTPVCLIEAMASGKACIATDVGGVRDILRDGTDGILVMPSNLDDFCRKLKDLIKDAKKRSDLGVRARKVVTAKYAKERLVKDVELLYEHLYRKNSRDVR